MRLLHCWRTHLVPPLDGSEPQHEFVSNAHGHDGYAVLLGQHGQEREQHAEHQVSGRRTAFTVFAAARLRPSTAGSVLLLAVALVAVPGPHVPAVAQERQQEEHARQHVGPADHRGHGVRVHRVHGEQGGGQQCAAPAHHGPGDGQHQAGGQSVQCHVRSVVRRSLKSGKPAKRIANYFYKNFYYDVIQMVAIVQ